MTLHHVGMDLEGEATALGAIQERLAERFTDVGDVVIEAAVRMAYADLQGPIREFVPVLVEHAARDRLRQISGTAAGAREADQSDRAR